MSWLLEELYATEDDLSRSTDNGYTRGCTTFGRQRSRIVAEAASGNHAWLGLPNGNNDVVFTIGCVPCRFSNDDPANPSKAGPGAATKGTQPRKPFDEHWVHREQSATGPSVP